MGSSASPSDGRLPVGRLVYAYRKERGMSRQALADKAGISYSRLVRIEGGSASLLAKEVPRLADVLTMPRSLLLEEAPIT